MKKPEFTPDELRTLMQAALARGDVMEFSRLAQELAKAPANLVASVAPDSSVELADGWKQRYEALIPLTSGLDPEEYFFFTDRGLVTAHPRYYNESEDAVQIVALRALHQRFADVADHISGRIAKAESVRFEDVDRARRYYSRIGSADPDLAQFTTEQLHDEVEKLAASGEAAQ